VLHFYVLRHGQAEHQASRDSLRQLTQHGIAEVKSTCSKFTDIASLDYIYNSPYIRARQTADIVASYANVTPEQCDRIVPSSEPAEAIQYFYEKHQNDINTNDDVRILIASHMPFVSSLINTLSNSASYPPHMPTAALAYLSCDVLARDCCELHWIEHP